MEFYNNRTIKEQARRLPKSFREHYKETALDRIEIDGCEIHGYFEYSFMEEKSYTEQPVRSQDGSINDLEDYTTFLTPRLIIKYNMMNIDDYRTLMTFLKSKNAFNVTCYDIVADRRVTHEMYFANPQMPIIYQQYLTAMGIKEYSIELIGTNRKTEEITFTLDGDERTAYKDDTWISYSLGLGSGIVFVRYSTGFKSFTVTTNLNELESRIYLNMTDAVYPHDKIVEGGVYTTIAG